MGKTVFTNGTFDVLTVGHFNILSFCRKLAGEKGTVIVALDSDKKIKNDKGTNRPIFSIIERTNQITDLIDSTGKYIADMVLIFNTNEELYNLIKESKTNVIVKGSDWEGNVIGSDLAEVVLFQRMPYSSSRVINTIIHNADEGWEEGVQQQ